MRLLPKRMLSAVAGAFNRLIRPLPEVFPLELLGNRKDLWVQLLRNAMQRSQRGIRVWTLKRRPPKGASHWRGERRPDKIAAAERHAKNPCFYGKLNHRRTGDLFLK